MDYDFEWDSKKALANRRKHSVTFELAATVFRDPRALTIFDTDHSDTEDRWITMGLSSSGGLIVVHHTFKPVDKTRSVIRIFSSRKATKNEMQQYGE